MGECLVKILLDTHVWIWSLECPENLGPTVRSYLEDPSHKLVVSAVSYLELAQLAYRQRIVLQQTVSDWARHAVEHLGAQVSPMTPEIALGAYELPGPFHPDPADRILVATAILEHLTLLTADERILACPRVRCLSAVA